MREAKRVNAEYRVHGLRALGRFAEIGREAGSGTEAAPLGTLTNVLSDGLDITQPLVDELDSADEGDRGNDRKTETARYV